MSAALVAGVLGQVLAHHMKVPGIVILLLLGVVLGPDGLDVVRPRSIGTGLPMLVELAVAIILFEGGLSLDFRRLKREAGIIRALITTGALVTAVGAALAARWVMGWDWPQAALFGTLVIVTGPTVITPLVRRIRVKRNLQTILEAEGILIDPIGAVVAVVALEVVVAGVHDPVSWPLEVVARLGVGVLVGIVGGVGIAALLRARGLVPETLRNILALSGALVVFELSNAIQPESGIMAVVAAGMVVGNLSTGLTRDLLEFKEQLTMLMVGMLFVLLAADVRVADVQALGWWALVTIGLLMLVVRPLAVAASTVRSGLSVREKAFLGWLSPRGIVAAAVASLFAQTLSAAGIPGGSELRALVFLVIAVTVVVQGLTGGAVASALGVRRGRDNGFAVVGAGSLARALAAVLQDGGHDVVLVDRNPGRVRHAEEEGIPVVFGDATDERVLHRADVECRRAVLVVTANDAVNVLVAQQSRELAREVPTLVSLNRQATNLEPERVLEDGHGILFGRPIDMERWNHHFLQGSAGVERWRFTPPDGEAQNSRVWLDDRAGALVLGLAHESRSGLFPLTHATEARPGEVVVFATVPEQSEHLGDWLREAGWEPAEASDGLSSDGEAGLAVRNHPPSPFHG